jgi:hypothetical protein
MKDSQKHYALAAVGFRIPTNHHKRRDRAYKWAILLADIRSAYLNSISRRGRLDNPYSHKRCSNLIHLP